MSFQEQKLRHKISVQNAKIEDWYLQLEWLHLRGDLSVFRECVFRTVLIVCYGTGSLQVMNVQWMKVCTYTGSWSVP